MNIIKKTASVCPICSQTIKAIILKEKGIWMLKRCENHGVFKTLLETDEIFYQQVYNKNEDNLGADFALLCVTHRCNLRCSFCAVPNRDIPDESLDWIKRKISDLVQMGINWIGLTGGEPTLREDLPEIINFIRNTYPGVLISLVTNGIRLSDATYLKTLIEAGIDFVSLSINDLDEITYQKMNDNSKILAIKLRALENLKKEGIKTGLSIMLLRDVNPNAISALMSWSLDNLDFIEEIRIRNATMVGRFEESKEYMLSEMVDVVLSSIGKDRNFVFKNFGKEIYHSSSNFCFVIFLYKGKIIGKTFSEYYKSNLIANVRLLEVILRYIIKEKALIKFALRSLQIIFSDSRMGKERMYELLELMNIRILRIKIWKWPREPNIDFNEIATTGGLYVTNEGEIISLYRAISSSSLKS